MIIKREIGEKGQVVIPKDIRRHFGLDAGISVFFEVEDDKIIIKKEKDNEQFLKDFLNIKKIKRNISTKELKRVYEEQYEEEIH